MFPGCRQAANTPQRKPIPPSGWYVPEGSCSKPLERPAFGTCHVGRVRNGSPLPTVVPTSTHRDTRPGMWPPRIAWSVPVRRAHRRRSPHVAGRIQSHTVGRDRIRGSSTFRQGSALCSRRQNERQFLQSRQHGRQCSGNAGTEIDQLRIGSVPSGKAHKSCWKPQRQCRRRMGRNRAPSQLAQWDRRTQRRGPMKLGRGLCWAECPPQQTGRLPR